MQNQDGHLCVANIIMYESNIHGLIFSIFRCFNHKNI